MSKSAGHRKKAQHLRLLILVLLAGIAVLLWWKPWIEKAGPLARLAPEHRFTDEELAASAAFIQKSWEGDSPTAPAVLHVEVESIYIGGRAGGRRLADSWLPRGGADERIREALENMRTILGEDSKKIDTLEIFMTLGVDELDNKREWKRLRSNIHRGVYGLRFGKGPMVERYSPLQVIASNRSVERYQELYRERYRLEESDLRILPYAFLHGPQLIVKLGEESSAQQLDRGNIPVQLSEVDKGALARFAQLESDWLRNNTHDDGRMTYLFNPSQGKEAAPEINNLIRQFMASVALGRVARRSNSDADWTTSRKNLEYNLRTYFTREGELGITEWKGKVKLGALALLALAIVEHRDRADWAEQEAALLRSIDSLWKEDGSFESFLRPEGHRPFHNFYPGEALLLWATLYEKSEDPALLERIMASFRYYREWHLDPANRNPAFIPWHSQAYLKVWKKTKNDELASFVLEMNDWLLHIQEWDDYEYEDTRGRFYSRPYGPPHASSTGVYLEGLAAAYQLAEALGDQERADAYALAIRRGLRSLMQLQFVDELDMFYSSQPKRLRGGLRTTVYNNKIRCDNVQHSLMAALELLDTTALD